jgi:hypothetical protein
MKFVPHIAPKDFEIPSKCEASLSVAIAVLLNAAPVYILTVTGNLSLT